MNKSEMKEPIAPDLVDEIDPSILRKLWDERVKEEGIEMPPESEFLNWIRQEKYKDES